MATSLSNCTVYTSGYPYSVTSTGTLSITTSSWGCGASSWSYGTGGGGGSASSIMTIASSDVYDNSDVTIKRPNGTEIRVGECLETIMETLFMIIPDKKLMGRYPALDDAFKNHMQLIRDKLHGDHDLKDSYESYQMIKKLVIEDQSNE
jgi:hypothetical protein